MQKTFWLVVDSSRATKQISLEPHNDIVKILASISPLHGWARGDLLALAAVIVAAVVAIVPPLRRYIVYQSQALLLRAGFPRRQYTKWFVEHWGTYDNPYLDDTESLSLSSAFVPLSFHSEDTDHEVLSDATTVLANKDTGNLIIEGAPGAGKSTLMKAYGVGALQNNRTFVRPSGTVPFLIQLRKLARSLDTPTRLADYLVDEILVSGAGMSPARASAFLRYSLDRHQVLVMLDGLDEITANRYNAILEAVYQFVNDRRPDCPTYLARVIVTCRRQNFMSLRDQWVPAIAKQVCSLAPLRNSEIFNYLNKHRSKFKAADGPENFFQAVRASGTIDLHRVPLILAMSVGLYARKAYYEVPSSIAKLYQAMIEEMLDRHRFKRDPGGSALTYQVGDKFRYLREFALHAASEQQGFDEFSKTAIVDFSRYLAPNLDAVKDPEEFADEIILRSGLLADVAENGMYVFAHRSIQEYLTADELRTIGDGDQFLLDRANDPEWRQVIQFYTAGQEQRRVNPFLERLSQLNPTLAGYCLMSAKPSDEVAAVILNDLKPIDGEHLDSLTAATMSARLTIQEMAIEQLKRVLPNSLSALVAMNGDAEGMLPLLNSLAGTNAAEIAAFVPDIIQRVPDDPRLVEPLWRCLTAAGIERLPASHTIVKRLLDLVMDPNAFEQLALQAAYTRDFITEQLRHQAYPFIEGLRPDHNLITLLAWAEYLQVAPSEPNRFFDAKTAGRLGSVEKDRKRTIAFSLFWPARIFSSIMLLAGAVGTIIVLSDETRRQQLTKPFGWWTLALILGVPISATILYLVFDNYTDNLPTNSWTHKYLVQNPGDGRDDGNVLARFVNLMPEIVRAFIILMVVPAVFGIASTPLLGYSWLIYTASVAGGTELFYILVTKMFGRSTRHQIYRPSPYVDVYDDVRSRYWVRAESLEEIAARKLTEK